MMAESRLRCWVSWKEVTSITEQPASKSESMLYYDRRSVGQSVLISSHHLGPATNSSISSTEIISDIWFCCCCCLVYGALPDERTDLWFIRTSATGPCQRCHFQVQVPQKFRPCLTLLFEAGFPFYHILRFAGIRWKYFNPPLHGVPFSTLSQNHCTTDH
jgi:hypothetical protein